MKNGKGKGKGGSRPGSDVVYPDFLSAIKGKGNEIVDKLSRADVYNIFAEPVDPNEVVGYLTIIKSPMDLGTVRQKLESGKYSSLDNLEADVDLIWSNCCTFNPPSTVFFKNAVKLRTQSEKYFRAVRDYFAKNQIPTSTGEGESSDSDKGQREGKNKQAKSSASNDVKRGRKPGFVKKETPGLESAAFAKEKIREKRVPTATLIESHHLNQIPRAKFDVQDPLWKELGARPRGNPCRPMASITSVRMKDYATSLMFFANPGGTLARRAVTDLVGAERKPQQVATSKKLEMPKKVTQACPKEVDELIRRSNLVCSRFNFFLNAVVGFSFQLIGIFDLLAHHSTCADYDLKHDSKRRLFERKENFPKVLGCRTRTGRRKNRAIGAGLHHALWGGREVSLQYSRKPDLRGF